MHAYVSWVGANPMLSAALQFALLGTLGELIPHWIRRGKGPLPFSPLVLLGKILAWAILGLVIKYGFAMMKGGTNALLEHGLLPTWMDQGVGKALATSALTNLFFGPQMMAFHRLEDNLILRERGFAGITKAWWTLLWFWIPAHTLTFSLPVDYQIGLAALWSVVLGVILGFSKPAVD